MKTVLALLMLFVSYNALAKKMVVKGVVTDSTGQALTGAQIVIYTNKYDLLAKGYTDDIGSFLLPAEINDIDRVVIYIKLRGYISAIGTLSRKRLEATSKYVLSQDTDTIYLSVRLRKDEVVINPDGGLTIICGERTDFYSSPKMHYGIWGWRSYKMYKQIPYNK